MQPDWKKDAPVSVFSSMSEIVVSLADTVQEPVPVDVPLVPPWPPPLPLLPPLPLPLLPPLPPVPVSLFAQEPASSAKAPHMASEAKARLTFMIVLFLAFMSPSWLVFTYSIAERPNMGKDICEDFPVPACNASRLQPDQGSRCVVLVHVPARVASMTSVFLALSSTALLDKRGIHLRSHRQAPRLVDSVRP
jgi:hypothetical protein